MNDNKITKLFDKLAYQIQIGYLYIDESMTSCFGENQAYLHGECVDVNICEDEQSGYISEDDLIGNNNLGYILENRSCCLDGEINRIEGCYKPCDSNQIQLDFESDNYMIDFGLELPSTIESCCQEGFALDKNYICKEILTCNEIQSIKSHETNDLKQIGKVIFADHFVECCDNGTWERDLEGKFSHHFCIKFLNFYTKVYLI